MNQVDRSDQGFSDWAAQARPELVELSSHHRLLEAATERGDLAEAALLAQLVLDELSSVRDLADRCPQPAAATELRAGLDVLRNAALLLRSLERGGPAPDMAQPLLVSCQALLNQTSLHLTQFRQLGGIQD